MGNIVNAVISEFNGGIIEDKRLGWTLHRLRGGILFSTNSYSLTKHFDAFTFPHKLVPHYKTEAAGADSAATQRGYNILQTLYAPYEGAYRLYGLGVASGHPKLFIQNIDAGDLDPLTWSAADNGACASGSQIAGSLFYYKDYIYFYQSATRISRFKTSSTTALTEDWQDPATTATPVQPVRHPSDDIAYFFSDTHVYSWDNSNWTDALSLPSDMTIVAACPFGNYLAIAMTTNATQQKQSIVFLWDRNSSVTTLTERIDFGVGTIRYLANLQGKLVAVMDYYGNNTLAVNKGKILIKRQNGTFADTINYLNLDATVISSTYNTSYFVENEKLYFVASATLNTDTRYGIWAVDYNGRFTLDTIEANSSTTNFINFIYKTAEIFWIGYFDGTGNVVSRTDEDGVYSTTTPSIYESLIFTGADSSQVKKLIGITVTTEPLPAAGEVIVKYRRNVQNGDNSFTTETAWTQISDHTTDNSILHESVNIESSGATLPSFNEIQFQINSYGGAVITGISFQYETGDMSPY